MTDFQPLDMQRAIRDDNTLTTTQLALLLCAVLRTDNGSRKVRTSLEGLAEDANCSARTAGTAFKHPQVLKYFARVDRYTRKINLWFHPTPEMVSAVTPEMVSGVSDEPTPETDGDSGNPVHDSGNPVHDSGNGFRPSAFTSAPSSALSDAPVLADAPTVTLDETEVRGEESSSNFEEFSCLRATVPDGPVGDYNPLNFEEVKTSSGFTYFLSSKGVTKIEEPSSLNSKDEEIVAKGQEKFGHLTGADWREIKKTRRLTDEENEWSDARARIFMAQRRAEQEAKQPVYVGEEW